MNILQDNKGNYSSIRFAMFITCILTCYMLWEFRYAFRLEVVKENPDYSGLALLFTAMVINFVLVILLKVLQKRYEE